jgi:hypothetical protein
MGQDAGVNDPEERRCWGCGARFARTGWALDRDLRAAPECWRAYGELTQFVLDHPAALGELQHLVADAYTAQHAGDPTPPEIVAVALVGLDLAVGHGLDAERVRTAQQQLAGSGRQWPALGPQPERADRTVVDVLDAVRAAADADLAGVAAAVRGWAEAVWNCWRPLRAEVAALTASARAPS